MVNLVKSTVRNVCKVCTGRLSEILLGGPRIHRHHIVCSCESWILHCHRPGLFDIVWIRWLVS